MVTKDIDIENDDREIVHSLPTLEHKLPLSRTLPWRWIIFSVLLTLFLYWLLNIPDQITYNKSYIILADLGDNKFIGFSVPLLFFQIIDQLYLLRLQVFVLISVLVIFMNILPKISQFSFLKQKSLSFGLGILVLLLFIAIFAPFIAPFGFDERHINCETSDGVIENCRQAPPNEKHIMGTTRLGWDLYSRVIYGAIIPFQMAILAVIIALVIGIPTGLLSGYFGGLVDRSLNAFMDLLYSFPSILFAISLSLFLTEIPFIGTSEVGDTSTLRIILVVGFSVGLVYIPTFFKIVRAQVFQIKELAYIEAPRSIGASDTTIMSAYVLPNVIASPLALIPFPMVDAILVAAALAFLGIGIQAPTADWGYDLTKGAALVTISPWWITFPAIMIFLFAFSSSLIGDALNDRYNPLLISAETLVTAEETVRKSQK